MLAKFQIYGLSAERKTKKQNQFAKTFSILSQFLIVLQLVYFNIIFITSCSESLGGVASKREIDRHRVNNQHHKYEFVLIA